MKTLVQLRSELQAYRDEAAAILAKAKEDNRDLTSEEDDRLGVLCGTGAEGTEQYRAGLIKDTVDAVSKAERYEARMSDADILLRNSRPVPVVSGEPPVVKPGKITIPATCARRSQLKSFRGDGAEERAYASGQWILAALYGNQRSRRWCDEHGIGISNVMSEGADSAGGFLVPNEFSTTIIDLKEERGVFRQFARREAMMSDTKTIPRRTGGLTMYYPGENTEITASDKTWGNVQLTARKGAVMTRYSSEVNEDAVISMADDLAMEIAYAFANGEDTAGFSGDGTSTYGGITGLKNALLAGSKVTAASGNTAFGTLDLDDFEAMIATLPLYALQSDPAWYIHRAGWASSMLRLAAAAGGNTMADIAGGMQQTFLGFPVRFSQVLNSTLTAQTSTVGLCYFGSLRQTAAFGDRRGTTLAVSTDRYFELDQLAIKGTERFDIVVHETGTASVPGSMIVLATPAS
jgi:HK97 family phage major capsid protein